MNTIRMVKATAADRNKGESYAVHNGSEIVKYNNKLCYGLKRETARDIAAENDDWDYGSLEWCHDKKIK